MKQISLLLFVLLFPFMIVAQKSLDYQIEEAAKSNNLADLNKKFDPLYAENIDEFGLETEKLLLLGEKYKSQQTIIYSYLAKSYFFFRKNDLVQMQNYLLKVNHLLDKYPNHFLQGVSYQFMTYLQPTDDLKLCYCKKAVAEFQQVDKKSILSGEEYVVLINMGDYYTKMKKVDSALYYIQKGEKIILSKHKPEEYLVMINAEYSNAYLEQNNLPTPC